jgi:hypothetical protein
MFLKSGPLMPQQPDHLDIAVGLSFEPPAGSDPVQVTANVELQQIRGRIAGTASLLRLNTREPDSHGIKPVDKSLYEIAPGFSGPT